VTALPSYVDLLGRIDAPPGSSWHVFGPDDELGMLNNLTPECTRRATSLVKRGRVFNLDYPLNTFVPSLSGTRPPTAHRIFANNAHHRDDWLDSFYLQSTSQIDGLRHIRHPVHGFYGGVADDAIDVGGPALGIQRVAERGIVGRGVLIDMPRHYAAVGWAYDLTTNHMVTVADLDDALRRQGVALERGDILLLHTGWAAHYLSLDQAARERRTGAPGLQQSPQMLAWLWDHGVSLVAADNGAVEAYPVSAVSGFHFPDEPPPKRGPVHNGMMHRQLLALLGLLLGELWKLDELSAACAEDGSYAFLVTAKPLNLVGGVGSPPNAMAVK
jgi:kynurenine formamidase